MREERRIRADGLPSRLRVVLLSAARPSIDRPESRKGGLF